MSDDELTPERIATLTAAVDIEASPPDSEPVALVLFGTAVAADFALMYAGFGPVGSDYVFNGPGLGQLEAYLLIVVLACLGYGAVFLLLSMMFRNPMPAALLFLGWEAINPVMPSLLQKISVASYLRHLMPINVPGDGLFALLTVQTDEQ